jgi:hypothetical protein
LQTFYRTILDYGMVTKAKEVFAAIGKMFYAINSNSIVLPMGEPGDLNMGKPKNGTLNWAFRFSCINAVLCSPVGITNAEYPNQYNLYDIIKVTM